MKDRGKDRHKQIEKRREYLRAYQYAYGLEQKYGITVQQFEELIKLQNNRCLICDKEFELRRRGSGQSPKTPVVDHDHASGAVRGILCNGCNVALGAFYDSAEILARAMVYLKTAAVTPALRKAALGHPDELLEELIKS